MAVSKTEEDLQKWKDDDKLLFLLTDIRPTAKACVLEVFCEHKAVAGQILY